MKEFVLKNLSIKKRLIFLFVIFIIIMVFISFYFALFIKEKILEDKKDKLIAAVDTAYGVLNYYYSLAKEVKISEEEAKKLAISVIKQMRYQGKEYFWINDDTLPYPKVVMHPIKPDLEGKIMDSPKYNDTKWMQEGLNGKIIKTDKKNHWQAFVEVCKAAKMGFVQYEWQKSSSDTTKYPKLSFVKYFEPWGWVIGSGILIDDVDRVYYTSLLQGLGVILIILIIFLVVNYKIGYSYIIHRLNTILYAANKLSKGDLNFCIYLEGEDEIAKLGQSLNKAINEIYHLTFYDKITGLPNLQKFYSDISKEKNVALILIDLINFKNVNAVYGLETGDKFLRAFAQKLIEFNLGEVYRVGPDEFAILLKFPEDIDFNNIKKELLTKLESITKISITLNGMNFYPDFIAVGLCGKDTSRNILFNAYSLLDEAEARGLKFLCEFNPEEFFRKRHEEALFWFRKFKAALENDRIVPYYQPIVDNETKKVVKFEALVRLIDENGEAISPFKFLEVASKAGYGPKLTQIMLSKVVSDFRFLPFEVSVNLSYRDFLSEELLSFVEKVLEEEMAPRFGFEFLETEEIGDPEKVFTKLKEFKKRGVKLAIDDFGSGYSSLQRLIELQVDYIKIDASLIKRLPHDENAYSLIKAIVRFAREVGIKTVAEFVADEEIFKKVCEVGIDYSQGYYFSPPLPLKDLKAFLS